MPTRSPHRLWSVLVGGAAIAIIAGFLIAATGTVNRRHSLKQTITAQQHTDRVICERVNGIYQVIQAQLRLALVSTPKLSYYKTHPKELADVQAATRKELKAFSPKPCPNDQGKPKNKVAWSKEGA